MMPFFGWMQDFLTAFTDALVSIPGCLATIPLEHLEPGDLRASRDMTSVSDLHHFRVQTPSFLISNHNNGESSLEVKTLFLKGESVVI